MIDVGEPYTAEEVRAGQRMAMLAGRHRVSVRGYARGRLVTVAVERRISVRAGSGERHELHVTCIGRGPSIEAAFADLSRWDAF